MTNGLERKEMERRLEFETFMAKVNDVMERTGLSLTDAVGVVMFGEWPPLVEGKIIPRPPDCGKRSVEVRQRIFETSKNAETFGDHVLRAFKETEIELEDDETFTCLICIVKKPKYISEVMDPTPEPAAVPLMMKSDSESGRWPWGVLTESAYPPIKYIMEPTIMRQVMEVMERDKIKY